MIDGEVAPNSVEGSDDVNLAITSAHSDEYVSTSCMFFDVYLDDHYENVMKKANVFFRTSSLYPPFKHCVLWFL